MKKKYLSPCYSVTIIEIEDSYCNASASLTPSSLNTDILSEYETLEDDNRTYTW